MSRDAMAAMVRRFARAQGIQLSYTRYDGRRARPSVETLLAVLTALGHDVGDEHRLRAAVAADREHRERQVLPPVVVATPGRPCELRPRDGDRLDHATVAITLEDGGSLQLPAPEVLRSTPDGVGLDLAAAGLPVGYHELRIDGLGDVPSAMLVVPPRRLPPAPIGFGVFQPLYGLRGERDWGVGDLGDLRRLQQWVAELAGDFVGTLPLFATYLDPPVDPSPYLPVSRRFWSELYVDVEALPEFAASPDAQALAGSPAFQQDLRRLSRGELVDYAGVMARKRGVLELCASELFDHASPRRDACDAALAEHPEIDRYAEFRAGCEKLGRPWLDWPAAPGVVPDGGADDAAVRYYRYAQLVAGEQLAAAAAASPGLYLDLPIGVHPDGFDTWSEQESFAPAEVGAPPDDFFAGGQAWGFPPLHPGRMRARRYGYLIDCLRHTFRHARVARIDHILGLHRQYWVPAGTDATGGAYVTYPADELRAIVRLEAARAGTIVVGEDLGTVTPAIRQAMDRDGMLHSFVYQFAADATQPLPQPDTPAMASLGSHDLPKFASYAATERWVPPLQTCLTALADGSARLLLVDLADLAGQEGQDNQPGTGPEADNWRRRLDRPLAELTSDSAVTRLLTEIAEHRQRRATTTGAQQ
ncbi:MAG TPA: 4-alpha-glucanotransferase [Mycobacteriales bacterium]|nr:4-alpha-glucanotransferase [Mycobacteriales bacterium]